MSVSATKATVLCVGVSKFDDKSFAAIPSAADSAKQIADGFEPSSVGNVQQVVNPSRNEDLFVALQRAVRDARRGTLIFYFAGNVLRRERELLLAVGDSEVSELSGCVPLTDFEELLLKELVTDALIILNVHKGDLESISPKLTRGGLGLVGLAHAHDTSNADARIREGANWIATALSGSAADLKPFLNNKKLDGEALSKFLKSKASSQSDVVYIPNGSTLVLRDLTEALKDPPPVEVPAPTAAVEVTNAPTPEPVKEVVVAKPVSAPPPAKEPAPEPTVEAKPEPKKAAPVPPASAAHEEETKSLATVSDAGFLHDSAVKSKLIGVLAVMLMLLIGLLGLWMVSVSPGSAAT